MQRLGTLMSGGRPDASRDEVDINMMPLIDMIFILLIFFLVTASFVRESGVEVNRPEAVTAEQKDAVGLVVGITAGGRILIDHQEVELHQVRGLVELFLAENTDGGVIIDADGACTTARMVAVLDQARLAGAKHIAVAASQPGK